MSDLIKKYKNLDSFGKYGVLVNLLWLPFLLLSVIQNHDNNYFYAGVVGIVWCISIVLFTLLKPSNNNKINLDKKD